MQNHSNGLRFDVYERVHLPDSLAAIDELDEIELVPRIQVEQYGEQVMLKGHLLLSGVYRAQNDPDAAQLLEHRIPVEITLPMNRVNRLDDISVEIDNFDVDLLSARTLNITGVLSLYGIVVEQAREQEDWEREEPFTVVHARESEAKGDSARGGSDSQFAGQQQPAHFGGWAAPPTQAFREFSQREAEARESARREAEAQEAARREAESRDAVRRDAEAYETPRNDPGSFQEEYQEAFDIVRREEEAQREAELAEAVRREAEAQEFARREAEAREAARREEEACESARREAEAQEFARREADAREAARREAEARESARREAEAQEFARQEAEDREAARREAEAAALREAALRESVQRETAFRPPVQPAPDQWELAYEEPQREVSNPFFSGGHTESSFAVQENEKDRQPHDFTETPVQEAAQFFAEPNASFGDVTAAETEASRKEMRVALGSKPAQEAQPAGVGFRSLLQSSIREQEARAAAEQSAKKAAEAETRPSGDEIEWKNLFLGAGSEESFRRVRMCIVQREETLETIAGRYHLQPREILLYNRLSDQNITEGQVLYIP